ncbi:uncharacterized protein C8A04DRAFT_28691 [Dichotomopilus funicola]|uniref:Phospho-2-dehydro-3-deoxyheptonate aldolase n=1 Tax=Dichotomopilus funicola TaxID=1934379 RepID=A0AAN6V2P1_9PEZI|nr:hypothetical protein C8A04DRAFT_28691 [Dichotomopilus funicola]
MAVTSSTRLAPATAKAAQVLTPEAARHVEQHRRDIQHALSADGLGERLLVVIGPCSIHDTATAMDYATRLATAAEKHADELLVAMRVYIEKPRTTVGWKGLVHDPDLTQSQDSDLQKGLQVSRDIMLRVAELGLPVVTEMLSPLVIPFLDDVLSLGVIGARTTESQTHRELASDVPFPVGFKNGTDGSLGVAIDAIKASERQHTLLSVAEDGGLVQRVSQGNPDTFVVLRGGKAGPNYSPEHVKQAEEAMAKAGRPVRLVVDCSHGNSSKDYRNQGKVAASVAQQFADGAPIAGLMIESNIRPGRQDIPACGLSGLEYGVSVTDGCVGWEETETILEQLANSVKTRRAGAEVTVQEVEVEEEELEVEARNTVVEVVQARDTRRSSFHQLIEKIRPAITTMEIPLYAVE